ncbi:hypothetical protein BH23BAC4_BH23BAC4_03650 [soil metagenome]
MSPVQTLPPISAPQENTSFPDSPWIAPLENKWEAATSFPDFLPTAEGENVGLWNGVYERATIDSALVARLSRIPGYWRLLVLSADWCGDAANTVPVIARLAAAAPFVDLRLLDRDEHLDLMDAHLTNGKARSIPVAVLVDVLGKAHGWWGPRPGVLQEWVMEHGLALPKDERYPLVRRWYARDKGRTTAAEITALIERAAGVQPAE